MEVGSMSDMIIEKKGKKTHIKLPQHGSVEVIIVNGEIDRYKIIESKKV